MTQTAVQKASAAVAAKPAVTGIKELVQSSIDKLRVALPAHMNVERIVSIAMTTIRLNPKLMECSGPSFLGALFQSAQLGLEPNINGEAWIIPYKNSRKVGNEWVKIMEAQFQVGAYGWVKLFYNHQNSETLQMENVHESDQFSYDLGTSEVHHVPPPFGKPRGPVIGYYALGTMKNGGKVLKLMSKEEAFEHGKKHSKCWDKDKSDFMKGTPWKEHFDAMAQVSVLKQVLKLLPKSVEIQKALQMDQTTKNFNPSNIVADMAELPDETQWQEAEVVDNEKLTAAETQKPELVVENPAVPEPTGDPVIDKSAKEKALLEGTIRTIKAVASIEKVMEMIQLKANGGDLTEADRRDLVEKLELKQAQLIEAEKGPEVQGSGSKAPQSSASAANHPAGGEFDPNTEIINFGKHKGKPWIEVPTTWLQWLLENSDNEEKRKKSEATIRAKGGEVE